MIAAEALPASLAGRTTCAAAQSPPKHKQGRWQLRSRMCRQEGKGQQTHATLWQMPFLLLLWALRRQVHQSDRVAGQGRAEGATAVQLLLLTCRAVQAQIYWAGPFVVRIHAAWVLSSCQAEAQFCRACRVNRCIRCAGSQPAMSDETRTQQRHRPRGGWSDAGCMQSTRALSTVPGQPRRTSHVCI